MSEFTREQKSKKNRFHPTRVSPSLALILALSILVTTELSAEGALSPLEGEDNNIVSEPVILVHFLPDAHENKNYMPVPLDVSDGLSAVTDWSGSSGLPAGLSIEDTGKGYFAIAGIPHFGAANPGPHKVYFVDLVAKTANGVATKTLQMKVFAPGTQITLPNVSREEARKLISEKLGCRVAQNATSSGVALVALLILFVLYSRRFRSKAQA